MRWWRMLFYLISQNLLFFFLFCCICSCGSNVNNSKNIKYSYLCYLNATPGGDMEDANQAI